MTGLSAMLSVMADTDDRIRSAEVAAMLGVTTRTVQRLAVAGELPSERRRRGAWRTFRRADVEALIERQNDPPPAA